ncbi:hypothetical protein ACFW1M_37490 [Streptomyces inhibens]|uniref:hypothetical protein n=1 Tax=Streptomyces inhibens TaxID=2293571 RepID=UPI00369A59BB
MDGSRRADAYLQVAASVVAESTQVPGEARPQLDLRRVQRKGHHQRALLGQAHAVALRIEAFIDDLANISHQLITGSYRGPADLTALRARWQRTTPHSPPTARRRTPAVSRAGQMGGN